DHLLAVANWDSRAIDFYLSSGKRLDDPQCRFEFHARWQDSAANKADWRPDKTFAAYQAVNLLTDGSHHVFLVGFATSPAGKDIVDLFSLDLGQPTEKLVRKLASKPLKLGAENHFRYAAGLWIRQNALAILPSPRELGGQTRINLVR